MLVQDTMPEGPFPSVLVASLLGIKQSTVSTWADRGVFAGFDSPESGRGRARQFSLLDALTLALTWELSSRRIDLPELPAGSLRRWAGMWMQTRLAKKRVSALVIRYYGQAGSAASKTSILPNSSVLDKAPEDGARITLTFELDHIFLPLLQGLLDAQAGTKPGRVEIFDGIKAVV